MDRHTFLIGKGVEATMNWAPVKVDSPMAQAIKDRQNARGCCQAQGCASDWTQEIGWEEGKTLEFRRLFLCDADAARALLALDV